MFLLEVEFLNGDVRESSFYDQLTGVPKPQWAVELTVMDPATDEKYEVQITEGFPLLDDLKERKRKNEPEEVLRQVVENIVAQLPQRHTPMRLQVLKLKGKQVAFMKFVCRLVAVGQPA